MVLPVRPMEAALEERRRYPHCVVVRAVVSSEDLDRGYSNAIGPVEIIAATAAEAGFPEQAPPMAEFLAVLAHANFSPGFDTLFATARIGTADVEVLLDLVGSTEKAAVRKKVAKYVSRLEDVIARWPAIEADVRDRASSIPPEGSHPCDWKIASLMLDGRRTTLMFEDAANEDAEHGLEAKLDTKGKLVSVDRP